MIFRLCSLLLLSCSIFASAQPAEVESKPVSAVLILAVVKCESGFRHDAVGDDGVSRGIAQFRKETFYEFAAMAIKQKRWDFKKLGKPEWMNPIQQMFLLEWGIRNGYGRRWTCYRTLTGDK